VLRKAFCQPLTKIQGAQFKLAEMERRIHCAWLKDSVAEICEGTSDVQRLVIARSLLKDGVTV
jgi:alkylation response protein AidB-like acyl-CoA dehydrogenase